MKREYLQQVLILLNKLCQNFKERIEFHNFNFIVKGQEIIKSLVFS